MRRKSAGAPLTRMAQCNEGHKQGFQVEVPDVLPHGAGSTMGRGRTRGAPPRARRQRLWWAPRGGAGCLGRRSGTLRRPASPAPWSTSG